MNSHPESYPTQSMLWREPRAKVRRVLVIDEHPLTYIALRAIVQKDTTMQIIDSAPDGEDGLEKYRYYKPDMLILEIDLPQMNGIAMIRAIRQTDLRTRILVFTSGPAVVSLLPAKNAGANGFIKKTSSEFDVLQAIRAVFLGSAVFPYLTDQRRTASDNPATSLSKREAVLMGLLANGHNNKVIAGILNLSAKTVSSQKIRMLNRLGLDNILELATFARAHRLIE